MGDRRVGLWLTGAFGGGGTAVAVGLVTALPPLRSPDLDDPGTSPSGGSP